MYGSVFVIKKPYFSMIMSSNVNIFRVTGHLCHTKENNRDAGYLRRDRAHYDDTVMHCRLNY